MNLRESDSLPYNNRERKKVRQFYIDEGCIRNASGAMVCRFETSDDGEVVVTTCSTMFDHFKGESFESKDELLNDIAKGKRQDIVDIIYQTMDGNQPDLKDLSKELQDYVKTTNVLMGRTLYSDSWLEL